MPFPVWLASGATTLAIQTSEISITPPERLPLGGYTARHGALFEPGGDDLKARCLILGDNQGTRVAVVAVEMLTVPESLVREVDSFMPEGVLLFLVATHTHSAPDSQMLNDRMTSAIPGIATYRSRWLKWYAEKVVECVYGALRTAPARYSDLVLKTFRHRLNQPRRKGADPESRGYMVGAPSLRPLILEYAAHPTLVPASFLQLSGDWPGALANRTGAIVLTGAIGDVSPEDNHGIDGFVARFRRLVTEAPAQKLKPFPFLARFEKIDLPAPKPHPDLAKRNGLPDALAATINAKFAPPAAAISALRLGKLAIVGVPGEPSAEIGRRIELHGLGLGFSTVLVISHVNGWIGYILAPDDYDRGGYEATLSFYGRDIGPQVVAAADKALDHLARPQTQSGHAKKLGMAAR